MGLGKSFGVNLLAAMLLLGGCDKARSLISGGSEGEATPSPEPEQPTAATDDGAKEQAEEAAEPAEPKPVNEADVKRFDDEQAVPEDIKSGEVFAETSVLLDAPEGGKVIATLTKGTKLEKSAEHGKHTLVIAPNPDKPNELLLGWLDRGALLEIAPTSSSATAEEPTAEEPSVAPTTPPPTTPPPSTKPTPPKPPPPKTVAPKPSPKPTPKPAPAPAPTPKKKKKKKGDTG